MTRMWKRILVGVIAGAAWAVTTVDALAQMMPGFYDASVDRVVIGVACISTMRLFLWCNDRPIGQAYELGYDRGHREAMREFNLKVTPIRKAPRGLTEFNTAHRKRLAAKVDA